MKQIFLKEIRSFFSSIVGYVVLIMFFLVSGLFMWILPDTNLMDYGYASMEKFFSFAPWLLIFIIPAISMRSFADEFKLGTIELLSTKPIKEFGIIMGKFWAVLLLVLICILPTLLYVYSINVLSTHENSLDYGGIIGSYIGLVFLVGAFTAIGIFCSSLTDNQVVAFLIAVFINLILYLGIESISKIPSLAGGADYFISLFGLQFHYQSISRGLIDSRDVVYFISVIYIFILATRLLLQKRKWA